MRPTPIRRSDCRRQSHKSPAWTTFTCLAAPNLFKPSKKLSASPPNAGGSGNGGSYTGADFRAAYARGVTLTGSGQVVGILELEGYNENDIRMYEQQNGIPNVPL